MLWSKSRSKWSRIRAHLTNGVVWDLSLCGSLSASLVCGDEVCLWIHLALHALVHKLLSMPHCISPSRASVCLYLSIDLLIYWSSNLSIYRSVYLHIYIHTFIWSVELLWCPSFGELLSWPSKVTLISEFQKHYKNYHFRGPPQSAIFIARFKNSGQFFTFKTQTRWSFFQNLPLSDFETWNCKNSDLKRPKE